MKSFLAIALFLLSGFSVGSAADEAGDLAVIANKTNPTDTLSLSDLRLMMLGEKPKWPNGKPVAAVETAPDSPEKLLLSKFVTKMSEPALKRYYMLAAFNGKEIAAPKDVPSAAALKQFVAANPGAIGGILASEVDDTVKVLKIDGAAPGEPGYKLH
jgi:hypothetical protein